MSSLPRTFRKRASRRTTTSRMLASTDICMRSFAGFPRSEQPRDQGMTDLHATIALSRLVNPTSTGDRYCAQVFRFGDNNSPIFAIRYVGVSPDVILGRKNRDWLSEDDGRVLQKLMPWISTSKLMHGKVHRAYWNHENAMRSYYLDIRWTLIVSAFEALLNTKDNDVTWQFRDRVRNSGLNSIFLSQMKSFGSLTNYALNWFTARVSCLA